MFADDFDVAEALKIACCPRCTHAGLMEVSHEEFILTHERDRHQSKAIICPSLYVRCPSCAMVAEYPNCLKS